MTEPAKAREKAIMPDETILRSEPSFGWQKTTAAPIHVDAPAMEERISGCQSFDLDSVVIMNCG